MRRNLKRTIELFVPGLLKEHPAILPIGSRQAGKTRMLRHLVEGQEKGSVSLDDLVECAHTRQDSPMFLQKHAAPVLFDEHRKYGAFWSAGPMVGAVFANLVVSEMRRTYARCGVVPPLWYCRDRGGGEIDVVIERDGHQHPVEIKMSAKPAADRAGAFVRNARPCATAARHWRKLLHGGFIWCRSI